MGGGKQYHGSDFRLNFHHTNNARSVMNAAGVIFNTKTMILY